MARAFRYARHVGEATDRAPDNFVQLPVSPEPPNQRRRSARFAAPGGLLNPRVGWRKRARLATPNATANRRPVITPFPAIETEIARRDTELLERAYQTTR